MSLPISSVPTILSEPREISNEKVCVINSYLKQGRDKDILCGTCFFTNSVSRTVKLELFAISNKNLLF